MPGYQKRSFKQSRNSAESDSEGSDQEYAPRWHGRPTKAAVLGDTTDDNAPMRYRDLVNRATAFDIDDAFRPLVADNVGDVNSDSDNEFYLDDYGLSTDSEDDSIDLPRDYYNSTPAYEGAVFSVADFVRYVRNFVVRSKLNDVYFGELLKLLKLLLPQSSRCPGSLYLFRKEEKTVVDSIDYSLRNCCSECSSDLNGAFCSNGQCIRHTSRQLPCCGYGVADIKQQVDRLIKGWGHVILENLAERPPPPKVADVIDSPGYKSLNPRNPAQDLLWLNFNFHYDGTPLSVNRDVSLQPIQMQVLELPPPVRCSRGCLVLGSCYVGRNTLCNVKNLMEPIEAQIRSFNDARVHYKIGDRKFVVKLRLVQFLADLPAKAKMINMQVFSAFFGCTYCTQRGVTELPDISHAIFPYDEPVDRGLLRSPEAFLAGFQRATDSRAVYKGYKPGGSVLTFLSDILVNLPWSVVIDVMHQSHEGVAKAIVKRLVDRQFHQQQYCLGLQQLDELDGLLLDLKLPYSRGRTLRRITEYHHWKASEFRNFLTFGVPLLIPFVLNDIAHLFLMYATAMEILCGECVVPSDIDRARRLLGCFCKCLGPLFDRRMYTANVHLIGHLADLVSIFGPLSSYSAYSQESNLGYAKTLVNGSNGFLRQAMERLLAGITAIEPQQMGVGSVPVELLGKPKPVDSLTASELSHLRNIHGLSPEGLQGYRSCKIGRIVVQSERREGSRYNSCLVMYLSKGHVGNVTVNYGRVKAFVMNPNDSGLLYAVISRAPCTAETLVNVLPRPTDDSMAQEWLSETYASNYMRVDNGRVRPVTDFVPCKNIQKHAVVIEVPHTGTFVCSVPLTYLHD